MSKTPLEHFQDIKELEVADGPEITVVDILPYKCEQVEKVLKALEILKRNVKVCIDYGAGGKYISCALVFYIDNKKTIYVVDEAIKEQTPEHFKELELLKEVLE